jgi:plasmid stabilization system protein ParE
LRILYRREAADDVATAFRWYDAQGPGLGREFEHALAALTLLIETFPQAYPVVFATVRRALLARFPYAVYYRELDVDAIEVIGCLHTRQHPHLLRERSGDA